MVNQDPFFIQGNVLSSAGICGQHPLLEGNKCLNTRNFEVQSWLTQGVLPLTKLEDDSLLPLADGERRSRNGEDKNND